MTQAFFSMVFCVHRSGVTVAARLFQQAGLIVLDRAGLQAAACECHGVVAQGYERLLGPAPT